MSRRALRRLAFGACFLVLAQTLLLIALVTTNETDSTYVPADSVWKSIPDIVMTLTFASIGGLLAVKRGTNLVGWAMLFSGLGLLFGGVLGSYAELAVLEKPEAGLPAGIAAFAISAGSWTPLMAGVFLLLLLFPNGKVPSRRWRPIAKLACLGFALIWFIISTAPAELDPPFEAYENTLAFVDDERYLSFIFPVIGLCLFSIAAAAVDLFFRFRRSRGEEREQFKWLAFTAGLLAVSIPFSGTAGIGIISGVADVTFALGLLGLPISVGIAVSRYRLYDIDRIINRTLTYGLLTAGLVAIYLGLVVGLQEVLRSLNGGSNLSIVVTTLVVAALFLPARRRVQGVVDRRFNRRAYDAARTIEAFGARLRQQVDLDTLNLELLAVVNETMEPARASVWLRNPETTRNSSDSTRRNESRNDLATAGQ